MELTDPGQYRYQLHRLLERIAPVLQTQPTHKKSAFAANNHPMPSASKRDVAVTVEDSVMTVCRGLSDAELKGVSMCTQLAWLVASKKGRVSGMVWSPLYISTLNELGWETRSKKNLFRSGMLPRLTFENLALEMIRLVGCRDATPLVTQAIRPLPNSPAADALLKRSSQINSTQYGVTVMPVLRTVDNELKFGVTYTKLSIIDGQPFEGSTGGGDLPLGSGLSFTLNMDKFETMMSIVEPALRDLLWREFEEIRLS